MVYIYYETAIDAMWRDMNSAISFARKDQCLPSMNTSIHETKT